MTIYQALTVGAAAGVVAAAVLARNQFQSDRGLRRAFAGLSVSAGAAVALSFLKSAVAVWPLAMLMLGGMIFLSWSTYAEEKRKRRNGA